MSPRHLAALRRIENPSSNPASSPSIHINLRLGIGRPFWELKKVWKSGCCWGFTEYKKCIESWCQMEFWEDEGFRDHCDCAKETVAFSRRPERDCEEAGVPRLGSFFTTGPTLPEIPGSRTVPASDTIPGGAERAPIAHRVGTCGELGLSRKNVPAFGRHGLSPTRAPRATAGTWVGDNPWHPERVSRGEDSTCHPGTHHEPPGNTRFKDHPGERYYTGRRGAGPNRPPGRDLRRTGFVSKKCARTPGRRKGPS